MYIEHLNLVVPDIERSIAFYRAAFPHWAIRAEGEGVWNEKSRRWCHLGDNFQYITLNDNGVGDNRVLSGHQVGLAHFAFVVNDLDGVIERLNAAGFQPSDPGAPHPFRANKYFIDPAGFEVEFVQYFSDVPDDRNS